MALRPLGSESQKFIMQYLDPNARFLLNKKCPSLRALNEMFPLNISNVHLNLSGLTINDTRYKLVVVTKECCSNHPYLANEAEETERNNSIADKFVDRRLKDMEREEAKRKEIEDKMKKYRKRVAEIEEIFSIKKLFPQNPESLHYLQRLEQELKLLSDQIEQHELNPPVSTVLYTFVQLTIDLPGGESMIERLKYQTSIALYRYHFLNRLFSGFNKINVKTFVVEDEQSIGRIHFSRFPTIFIVKELKIEGDIEGCLDIMSPSLLNPSVEILVLQGETDYSHDLIKEAKLLIIDGFARRDWFLMTSNMEVMRRDQMLSVWQAIELIEDWRNNLYPIGRKLSIEFYDEQLVRMTLDDIKCRGGPGAVKGEVEESRGTNFPSCVTFPMSDTAELNVYACTGLPIEAEGTETPAFEMLYYIIFQIHPAEYATPW